MLIESISFALINAVISSLSAYIIYRIISKKADFIIEKKEKEYKLALETWLNSEKGAKALYSIGMLIGTGAKGSLGINTKGGKLKFQDILAQIAGNWIQGNMGKITGGLSNLGSSTGQELNIKSKDRKDDILRSA